MEMREMAKESHSHGSGKDNREVPVGHHLVLKKEKKRSVDLGKSELRAKIAVKECHSKIVFELVRELVFPREKVYDRRMRTRSNDASARS